MNLPEYVSFALSGLEENGYAAYLVGGCVRDFIMNVLPHDFDVTTNATPSQIQSCFSDVKQLDIGKKHGTITLLFDKEQVEITTYRIDGEYHDNRHPNSVEFTDKIELDLARRDFTVNAIAYSPTRGFCDPFCGREDIQRGVICCVGEPNDRFREDALRILRALRFSSRLGFEIDEKTVSAIRENTHLLSNIAAERVTSEIVGILNGKDAYGVITEFWDVFEFLFPELCGRCSLLKSDLSLGLYSLFFVLAGQDVTNVLKRMRLDTKTVKSVSNVILNLPNVKNVKTKADVKKTAVRLGVQDALMCFELLNMHEQAEILTASVDNNECMSLSQLSVNGKDLLGICDGEELGKMLNELLYMVIDEDVENEKNALVERARYILRSNSNVKGKK